MTGIPAIDIHNDWTEVTGLTRDGTYYDVDLAPFLLDSTPGVIEGVFLKFVTHGEIGFAVKQDPEWGVAGYDEWTHVATTGNNQSHDCAMWLKWSGAQAIVAIRLSTGIPPDTEVYITAECRATGCYFHPVPLTRFNSWPDYNQWNDWSVTLNGSDTYDDVEAVIIQMNYIEVNQGDWGTRGWGSTDGVLSRSHGTWGLESRLIKTEHRVVGETDVAAYQLYPVGKDAESGPLYSEFSEVGYIRKGHGYHGILNPVDQGLSTVGGATWSLAVASNDVPSNALGIFGKMQKDIGIPVGASWCGIQSEGSSTNVVLRSESFVPVSRSYGPASALLNGSPWGPLYEYYKGNAGDEFYLYGYLWFDEPFVPRITINSGRVVIDSQKVTIG